MIKNLKLTPIKKPSTFRKMAMGTWKTAGDPSVYGSLDIDMTEANEFIKKIEQEKGVKLTPGHLVGKAISHCLNIRPELNGMIRGSKLYLRDSVTLFYQVNIPGGDDGIEKADLAGVNITEAEKLSVIDLAKKLNDKASDLRKGDNKVLRKNMNLFRYLPWALTRAYLNLGSWLMYGLNLNVSFLGLPRDPFGSVMVTNIGSLGIDRAWAPLVPYSRVPLILAVGEVKDQVVAENGKVVIKPMLSIGVTFDHRFIDGIHGAHMAREFKRCFKEPESYLL